MASNLENRKAPTNADALVQRRLADVCRRLRRFEATGTLLLLAVVVAGYAMGMAVLDLQATDWFAAPAMRWLRFLIFLGVVVALLGRLLVLGYRRINPYYAARQLEDTVPQAHNSLINWLDLHEQRDVPAAFRQNLGAFAARQLKQSDPEQIIDRRPHWILGGVGLVLLLGLLILLARGPQQFFSLLRRSFLPFQSAEVASRTQITLVRPESGNVLISPNQALQFVARIDGRIPDINAAGAPSLLYRYQAHDDYLTLPLQPDDFGNWSLRMSGDQVRTGLWYKITAGDAQTPEYQVEVRAQPQALRFEVAYQYRPYLALSKKTVTFPSADEVFPRIEGHQGTEVELVVTTNRTLHMASVELTTGPNNQKTELPGQVLAEDPRSFRCRWVLERSGHFRVQFTSAEGETNSDRTTSYIVNVLEDRAPRVVLSKPGEDITLPANGTLELEGKAEDDLGIKTLTLRLQVVQGMAKIPLEAKPYLDGKSLRFEDGTYPDVLEYTELVPLDKVRTEKGQPFALTPGMVVEYWLEAVDNSDYPSKTGRLGKSSAFKVTIRPPDDPGKQQAERKVAQDRQQQQQKQQGEKLARQNKERQDKKTGQQQNAGDNQQGDQQLDKLKQEKQQTEDRLQKALEEQKREEQRGQGKGQEPPKSDKKQGEQGNDGGAQPQQKDKQSPEQTGQGKDKGQAGKDSSPGESKGSGQNQAGNDPNKEKTETKGSGPSQTGNEPNKEKTETKGNGPSQAGNDPNKQEKSETKGNNPNQVSNQGNEPGNTKPEAKSNPAQGSSAKDAGKQPQGAGQAKDQGPQAKQEKQPGSAKAEAPKADKGNDPSSQSKSAPSGQDAPSAQAKQDPGSKESQAGNPSGSGERRPTSEQGQAKAAESSGPKAQGKEAGPGTVAKDAPQPQAKKGKPDPIAGAGQAKKTNPEQAKGSGVAKDDPPAGKAWKEPTWDDIARLMDQMKKKEGLGDTAKELAEIGQNAKDPKMREAAKETLTQAGRHATTGQPKDGGSDQPPAQGSSPNTPEKGDNTAQSGTPKGAPNDPKNTSKGVGGNEKSNTSSGTQTQDPGAVGHSKPGGKGIGDEVKPSAANAEHAGRGGNLQLEDLKSRVTPELLKKAGLNEADWQRYLKQAEAYDELLRQRSSDRRPSRPNEARGTGSRLPGTGPSQVQGAQPNTSSPLEGGQALPPPELRDAQRRFSSK
jgi:hypothetical protein